MGKKFSDGAIIRFNDLLENREISVEIERVSTTQQKEGSGFSLFGKERYSVNLRIFEQKEPKVGEEITLRSGFGDADADATTSGNKCIKCIDDAEDCAIDASNEFDSSDEDDKIIDGNSDTINRLRYIKHAMICEKCKSVGILDELMKNATDIKGLATPNDDNPSDDDDKNASAPNSRKLRRTHKKEVKTNFMWDEKMISNVRIENLVRAFGEETEGKMEYTLISRDVGQLLRMKGFVSVLRNPSQVNKGFPVLLKPEPDDNDNDKFPFIPEHKHKPSCPFASVDATSRPASPESSNVQNESPIPIVQEIHEVNPKSPDPHPAEQTKTDEVQIITNNGATRE